MALTATQQNYIAELDRQAKQILNQGGESALLMSLADKMANIKLILDVATKEELNRYCGQYEGFYRYMKMMERLAMAAASDDLDSVLN